MAQAIRTPAGALLMVVFVAIDLRWLAQLAEQVELPPGYSLVIADQAGRVLTVLTIACVLFATEISVLRVLRSRGGCVVSGGARRG